MDVACLVEPFTYLRENSKGKGFRNELLSCFNDIYQLNEEYLKGVQEVIDILHNSSLLIDDIEDGSHVRRGKKCAHEVYGIPSTINAGNLMYFEAMRKLLELGGREDKTTVQLSRIFADSMVKLHIGQGKELYWREHFVCPKEEEYLDMAIGKTGELFKLSVRIMASLSSRKDMNNATRILEDICDVLGKYYQIENDIKGLTTGDLSEGKFTYPILVAVHSGAVTVEQIHGCSLGRNQTPVLSAIIAAGGLARSRDTLRRLGDELTLLLRCADVSAGSGAYVSSKVSALVEKFLC